MSIGTDEPLWTVNLKRALAAQLQLQVDSSSSLFDRPTGDYFNQHTGYHALEVFLLVCMLRILSGRYSYDFSGFSALGRVVRVASAAPGTT